MKKLTYFLLVSMVMLFSCAKDTLNEELDLKKATVTKTMKAWFCMNPDMTLPFVHIEGLPLDNQNAYLPGGGFISGHATHMGELITELCPSKIFDAVFDPATGFVSYKTEGMITGDNGDHYTFTGTAINKPDGTFYGTIWMENGTGKFEGMTGTVEMDGQGMCWTAEGFMTYEK